MRGSPMSLRQAAALRRQCLSIIQFSIPKPLLRHPGPFSLILRGVRELGHDLAFGGKPNEFVCGIHCAFPPGAPPPSVCRISYIPTRAAVKGSRTNAARVG